MDLSTGGHRRPPRRGHDHPKKSVQTRAGRESTAFMHPLWRARESLHQLELYSAAAQRWLREGQDELRADQTARPCSPAHAHGHTRRWCKPRDANQNSTRGQRAAVARALRTPRNMGWGRRVHVFPSFYSSWGLRAVRRHRPRLAAHTSIDAREPAAGHASARPRHARQQRGMTTARR